MSEEQLKELQEYNLEYLEAQNSEEIFGGDYTSSVELKYANKEIERLNKRVKELEEAYLRVRHQYSELEGKYVIDENIIKEAIEYIENNPLYSEVYDYDYEENLQCQGACDYEAREDLLKILNGSDKE